MPREETPIQCDCPWDGCGRPIPITPGEEVHVKDVLCPHCGQWCQLHALPEGDDGVAITIEKKGE